MKLNRQPAKQSRGRKFRAGRFLRDNKAVSALEYAILVGVVAVGIGAALVTFQAEIKAGLDKSSAKIKTISGLK